jgi:hypothetical protein
MHIIGRILDETYKATMIRVTRGSTGLMHQTETEPPFRRALYLCGLCLTSCLILPSMYLPMMTAMACTRYHPKATCENVSAQQASYTLLIRGCDTLELQSSSYISPSTALSFQMIHTKPWKNCCKNAALGDRSMMCNRAAHTSPMHMHLLHLSLISTYRSKTSQFVACLCKK